MPRTTRRVRRWDRGGWSPASGTTAGSPGGPPGGDENDLFQPFEQRSVDRSGLGLGLAFSRWAVEANHGRIYARNLPDKGCVFTVDLPRLPVLAIVGLD